MKIAIWVYALFKDQIILKTWSLRFQAHATDSLLVGCCYYNLFQYEVVGRQVSSPLLKITLKVTMKWKFSDESKEITHTVELQTVSNTNREGGTVSIGLSIHFNCCLWNLTVADILTYMNRSQFSSVLYSSIYTLLHMLLSHSVKVSYGVPARYSCREHCWFSGWLWFDFKRDLSTDLKCHNIQR